MDLSIDQTQHNLKIMIDGLDITKAIRSFEIYRGMGDRITSLKLDLRIDKVDVTVFGERDVAVTASITPAAEEVLQLLGWAKVSNQSLPFFHTIPREVPEV